MERRPDIAPTAATSTASPVDPMLPVPWRIVRRRQESADTFTWELRSDAARGPFLFAPGQFNMIYLPGVGEVPISISGDPDRPVRLVHTIRAVGSVTRRLEKLGEGDVVGVRGPFGGSWPIEDAEGDDVVFMAGGLGLAPLRPAIYHVLSHREDYGNVSILYGARSPKEILFAEQLQAWRGRFDLEVEVTVDIPTREWRGMVGVVTTTIPYAPFEPSATTAFVCGPEIMMRFCARNLEDRGVGPERIFLSMERSMKCGVVHCGHCQWGPHLICRDGPVFSYASIRDLLHVREL